MTGVSIDMHINGPLEPDWDAFLVDAAKELRIAADKTTPQSALNRSAGAIAQRRNSLRTSGGTLVRSHRFRILKGEMAIQWTNKKVYAAIQDRGGYIPPFDIRARAKRAIRPNKAGEVTRRTVFGTTGNSQVMLAFVGGGWRFFTKRKGFTLKGQDYTGRAIDLHLQTVKIRWAAGQKVSIGLQRGAGGAAA